MAELVLYHLPGACSRVTMAALEQAGAHQADRPVDLRRGEQRGPEYLAVNPRGKIPALLVDGRLLTENAAIMRWLHCVHPTAELLPVADAWGQAQQQSDLFWVSSVWHPSVRTNMMPIRWTTGDPAPVRARGKQLIAPLLARLEARLAAQPWWYGDSWSIINTYLWWAYTNAEIDGFSIAAFPRVQAHSQAHEALPQLKRALAREAAALARREKERT